MLIGDLTLFALNSNLALYLCVVIGELFMHMPNEPSVPDELFIIGLDNVGPLAACVDNCCFD